MWEAGNGLLMGKILGLQETGELMIRHLNLTIFCAIPRQQLHKIRNLVAEQSRAPAQATASKSWPAINLTQEQRISLKCIAKQSQELRHECASAQYVSKTKDLYAAQPILLAEQLRQPRHLAPQQQKRAMEKITIATGK